MKKIRTDFGTHAARLLFDDGTIAKSTRCGETDIEITRK